ncbi:MAG TPA: rRNA maturation RNase YbeY [Phnomibacter sp.]|nr:rRNA maturation RNase YbeY [Phnomibacter sp.]
MPITFSDADARVSLTNRRKLKSFIEHVLCNEEGWSIINLSYVFCSDPYLLDINKRFLDHDYYTDIITFDLGTGVEDQIEGEIYISIDRVKDNAKSLKISNTEELLRVIFHGILHLCGYRDKTPKEIKAMRAAEDKYLRLYSQYSL